MLLGRQINRCARGDAAGIVLRHVHVNAQAVGLLDVEKLSRRTRETRRSSRGHERSHIDVAYRDDAVERSGDFLVRHKLAQPRDVRLRRRERGEFCGAVAGL